jgi:hypothetical protein
MVHRMVKQTDEPLPVPDDLAFQHRVWRAERSGWIVLTLLVLAGLAGLFSDGFASKATVSSPDGGLRVEYARFARKTALNEIVIRLPRASAPETRIRLGLALAESEVIEALYPQPLRSSAGAGGLELTFAPAAAGDLTVYLTARARHFGLHSVTVEAEGVGSVRFWQLIYP